ncbi:MAG TPA: hypothetical protein VFW12_00225 [Candidatus Limnocylindria bacterium]|nr:hypothetical protein [Candidatus Limnocylindria bacterium]
MGDAVTLRIRLIGRPELERDGVAHPLAGHKPWALLTYLLLASRGPTRRELAERLWSDADDPLAALRWALLQVRRALDPEARIIESAGRLAVELPRDAYVDARVVLSRALEPRDAAALGTGELLEGFAFADAPAFDDWLALERQRVASALREALRWAATMLARSSPDEALRLAERALALDPLSDPLHELVVDIHVGRGDRNAAEAHAARADRRYREDLGTPAPETIRRPLDRATVPSTARVAPAVTAKALVRSAQARMEAGEYDSAVSAARRAAAEAAAAGDDAIEARALTTLGSILIHSVRGRDRESLGILARAFQLATHVGDLALASEIARETGYVAFLAADYGSAEQSFHRAIELAERAGDPIQLGKALTFLGASQMDRGDLEGSDTTLRRALAALDAATERRFRSFALSFVARLRLRQERDAEARELAREALASARETGWHGIVPWILTFEGEAELRLGDVARASELFEEAFALGSEMGDPCWEGLSLRGLAHIEWRAGRKGKAREMLADAHARCSRVPDTLWWADAVILTDLVELESGSDAGHLQAALGIARRGPMPDLAQRLRRYTPRQTPSQTPR